MCKTSEVFCMRISVSCEVIKKTLPVGVKASTAAAAKVERDDEALLSLFTAQIAEAEETKYPGLRQNVYLTRSIGNSMNTLLDTKPLWDAQCCVSRKDLAWVKQPKIHL